MIACSQCDFDYKYGLLCLIPFSLAFALKHIGTQFWKHECQKFLKLSGVVRPFVGPRARGEVCADSGLDLLVVLWSLLELGLSKSKTYEMGVFSLRRSWSCQGRKRCSVPVWKKRRETDSPVQELNPRYHPLSLIPLGDVGLPSSTPSGFV